MNENMTVHILFNTQAHIGHLKKFRHPQIKPFLYKTHQKLDIINLDLTLKQIVNAKNKLEAFDSQDVLVISDSYEAQEILCYNKWKPGMLTNFKYGKLKNLPQVLILDSVKKNIIALKEAKKLNILTIGLCDTDTNYRDVDVAIVTNDDSKNAKILILTYLLSCYNMSKM